MNAPDEERRPRREGGDQDHAGRQVASDGTGSLPDSNAVNRSAEAVALAERGWAMYPSHTVEASKCSCGNPDCASPGKHPIATAVRNGKLDAVADTGTVAEWWRRHPYANPSIATGPPSGGLIVIDLDGPQGHSSLAQLESELGVLPSTYVVTTGRDGGEHRYFITDAAIGTKTGVADKLDIISAGGAVIAAGSAHRSGRTYTAIDPDAEVAALPDVWADRLAQLTPVNTKTVVDPEGVPEDPIPEGQRHDTMKTLAAQYRRSGLGVAEIAAALQAVNVHRCRPPLPRDEILSLAEWFGDADGDTITAGADPSAFFDRQGRFIPKRAAEHLAASDPIAVGADQRLWRYTDGVWCPDGEQHVRASLRRLLDVETSKRRHDEVVAWFRADIPTITNDPPPRWINTTNGLVCWRTGELHPHSPDIKTTVQVPVAWQPDATCPAIDQFLSEVLPADAIDQVWEIIGYGLYAGNPLHKAVLLLGPGRNGKSVLLRIIRELYGEPNCSAVPLQLLAENRFAAAELYGKLANICGDLDARAVKRSDLFKMITGGDPITAERKYQSPFTFTVRALPIFSANEPPISSDQTEAWFRRWTIVPLERTFTDAEADPHLGDKLTDTDQLAGALQKAVEGLRRLMSRGQFTEPKSVTQAGDRYREKLDTVVAFIAEECGFHPDEWIKRSELYREYRQWCSDQGRWPVSATTFNDKLRSQCGDRIRERTRKGNRGWGGIAVGPLAPECRTEEDSDL